MKGAAMPKVWLITGSSRGLGRQTAEAVLAAGHRLVATARNPDDVRDLAGRHGGQVRAVRLDVTDPEAARAAVRVAVDEFGALDVVVNNAGYANVASFEDMAEDDFRAQMETDFFGVVNVTRAALPVLRTQRGGHIIQVSTIGDRRSQPGLSAYQTAKWAVAGFSEILAKEVAPFGVRVTVLEPGGMRTDWAGSSMRTDDHVREEYQPTVGRFIASIRGNPDAQRNDPAKVAQIILRLAEEEQPPVRLLLGTDAVFLAPLEAAARAEEDAKWRALSVTSDFDGLTDFSQTPIAQLVKPETD
jgi:NAD(P)-dependent dehydrogenase (short-subunit alcohol dehydrogenase family)